MAFHDTPLPGDRARAFLAQLAAGGPSRDPGLSPDTVTRFGDDNPFTRLARPAEGVSAAKPPIHLRLSHNPKDANFEKKKTPPLYYCERASFALVGPDKNGGGTRIILAPCKSNSCPYCGRVNMYRKQARIVARLQEDRDWGHDQIVDNRFVTSTLRPGAFYADNDTLRERVTRRLAAQKAAQNKLRDRRRSLYQSMLDYQAAREDRYQQKLFDLLEAVRRRDEVAAKGYTTGYRDGCIQRRRIALGNFLRGTSLGVCRFMARLSALIGRETLHNLRYDRKRRKLRDRRRRLVAEDAGLTPARASLKRAFGILKPSLGYANRQIRRPRAWNPRYRRQNWEGCRLEKLNDVDIQPGTGYPHVHALHWLTRHDHSSVHDMKPARQTRYLTRCRQETHYYLNNALRNACLELPLRWRVGDPYPYQAEESWGYVHDNVTAADGQCSRVRSNMNVVKYMAFHNGKIWKDGREYPKRYRRFAASRNLLEPLPEKPPSEWQFVKLSPSEILSRLAAQGAYPLLPGSDECAQDGTVLGLTVGLSTLDYRMRYALRDAPNDQKPAVSRDQATADLVAASDALMSPLLEFWEYGQGETWDQWQAGQVSDSLAATAGPGPVAPATVETSAEHDPFGGEDYHPETWRYMEWGTLTLRQASDLAAHTERARQQKLVQERKNNGRI